LFASIVATAHCLQALLQRRIVATALCLQTLLQRRRGILAAAQLRGNIAEQAIKLQLNKKRR